MKTNNSHEISRIPLRIAGMGCTTMLTQILFVREAAVWLRGNELIIAALIAAWLVWVAVGSAIGYLLQLPAQWVRRGWWLSTITAVALLLFLRYISLWRGSISGDTFSIAHAVALAVLIPSIPCALSGMAFATAVRVREFLYRDSLVSQLYVRETAGALFAGVVMTFLFLPAGYTWINLCTPLALILWDAASRGWLSIRRSLFSLLLVFACVTPLLFFHQHISLLARVGASHFVTGVIRAEYDLPEMRVTITETRSEANFYVNGRFVGSSFDRQHAEETAAYITLAADSTERICLLGFPYNGLIRQLIDFGWKKIDVIEPVDDMVKHIAPFLAREDYNVLTQKNVRIIHTDPRSYMRTRSYEKNALYDAVYQNVGIPDAYSTARLYTKNWCDDLHLSLKPTGVFIACMPGSPGYVPDTLAQLLVRLKTALRSNFDSVLTVPASSTYIVGCNQQYMSIEQEWWCAKWHRLKNKIAPVWFSEMRILDHLNDFRIEHFTRACDAVKDVRDRKSVV